MGTVRLEAWADQSIEDPTESVDLDPNYMIRIKRGRKQLLFLHTIDSLAQQTDERGCAFQPCLEDLVFLYGGERKSTEGAIKALKGKGLLQRIQVQVLEEPKYVPDILALSSEGLEYLAGSRKKTITNYEEWALVQSRIKQLLSQPQLLFYDQTRVSFFQVREMIRFVTPFLPASVSLDQDFIAKIAAFDKTKRISPVEFCQQVLGFVDALLRFQGSYIPCNTLQEIAKALKSNGRQVDLTKKKLYSHIQIGARLFGASRSVGRKSLFFQAVLEALNHYCEQFKIEEQLKLQIVELNNLLRELGRIALDPEARALGIMGSTINGLFLTENRKRYPLTPEMWLAGRDQMHQIRRLFRTLDIQEGVQVKI
ncbi:MAG: hypothetical protein ACXAEI_10360 [Candidatus Hodarchaeales archaeon]